MQCNIWNWIPHLALILLNTENTKKLDSIYKILQDIFMFLFSTWHSSKISIDFVQLNVLLFNLIEACTFEEKLSWHLKSLNENALE